LIFCASLVQAEIRTIRRKSAGLALYVYYVYTIYIITNLNTMKTATVNFKTDPKTKRAAQKGAQAMGLPLSTLLNGYLKEVANAKHATIHLDSNVEASIAEGLKDIQEGRVSGPFETHKDLMRHLNK
jgi:antitoxin component of RelBE/YafQ-DinJ toxin-antitoxin module